MHLFERFHDSELHCEYSPIAEAPWELVKESKTLEGNQREKFWDEFWKIED